eukprot:scaffold286102_cov30-Tisochrysis_lutea.AAC.1
MPSARHQLDNAEYSPRVTDMDDLVPCSLVRTGAAHSSLQYSAQFASTTTLTATRYSSTYPSFLLRFYSRPRRQY